jgi:hypothetical protein
VQLLDNWGVCNGVKSATDSTPTGNGGKNTKGELLCDQTSDFLFTPYQGYVIVKE